MKYNNLLLSAVKVLALLGTQVNAGNIEQVFPTVSDDFTVYQGTTELMRVNGDGNVSIGSITATDKLDVGGTTRVRTLPVAVPAENLLVSSSIGVLKDSNITIQALLTAIAQAQTLTDNVPDPHPPLPINITLDGGKVIYLASIIDSDYSPYGNPGGPATLQINQAADGTSEITKDLQGVLTTTGRILRIPYTVTSGTVTLPAFTQTITIPSNVTQDGFSRDVTLYYPAQIGLTGTGKIDATVKSTVDTLNAKKLDVQTGVGDGSENILVNSNGNVTRSVLGYLMGTFTIALNSAGDTGQVQLRDIAGIPDRMLGLADNNGSTTSHDFVYYPVTNPTTGKRWLNNNLGAHYSTATHVEFDISQQATASDDFHAYGSLFQWGRKADGHELINWTDSVTGVSVFGSTPTLSNNPTHSLFITTLLGDWRVNPDSLLWLYEYSANNVCPIGFKLPANPNLSNDLSNDFFQESTTWASADAPGALNGYLALSTPGLRFGFVTHGNVHHEGDGYYWTSGTSGTFSSGIYLGPTTMSLNLQRYKSGAESVRCIEN